MNKVYYINLEHRTDRNMHMINQFAQYDISLNRINAIYNNNGAIGCGLSHIKTLKEALLNDNDYSIIMEDDFYIFDHNVYKQFILDFNSIRNNTNWDMIVLTPRGKTVSNDCINKFKRIIDNQTATGYIIKKDLIPILIDNLKEAVYGLMQGKDPNIYAIDQYWKQMQLKYKFYYYENVFAGQYPGYSDIEKRMVNYNERFVNQIYY